MTSIGRVVAVLLAAGLVATSCGTDDDSRFAARTDAIRAAVAAGDAESARAELDRLGLEGLAARQDGELDDDELAELTGLIATAREQIDALVRPEEVPTTQAPATTAAPTTQAPTPPPAPQAEEDDHREEEDGDEEDGDDGNRGKGNKKDKQRD